MISDIHKQYVSKERSVTDVTNHYLKTIADHDKDLNAFITVDTQGAEREAKVQDKEIADTKNIKELLVKKPLFGVPVGLKDIYSTKDLVTTAGSNILKGYIPPFDATVVTKLKNAGAIIIGKLNCDAFAHGASGENSDFGPSKNPYDTTKIPGGSSSGSAVSVAASMCVIGMGSDTGGSVRQPASFTNTVGLKPSYGRVSRYGVIAMASSTDSIGHITQTVEDNARVLSVTAGQDQRDATSSTKTPDTYETNIEGGVKNLTIGVPDEYLTDDIDPEIAAKVQEVLKIFTKKGANIQPVSLPHTKYALAVYYIVMPSEVSSNLGRLDGIRYGHNRAAFGQEAKRRIMIGTHTLSSGFYDAYYLKAQKVRTLIRQDFEIAFEKADVLFAPVSPVMPPAIGQQINDPLKQYLMDVLTVPANMAGIPSLAVPVGFGKEGMPIGGQIMGKHFDEVALYKVGYALEQELQLFKQKPLL